MENIEYPCRRRGAVRCGAVRGFYGRCNKVINVKIIILFEFQSLQHNLSVRLVIRQSATRTFTKKEKGLNNIHVQNYWRLLLSLALARLNSKVHAKCWKDNAKRNKINDISTLAIKFGAFYLRLNWEWSAFIHFPHQEFVESTERNLLPTICSEEFSLTTSFWFESKDSMVDVREWEICEILASTRTDF